MGNLHSAPCESSFRQRWYLWLIGYQLSFEGYTPSQHFCVLGRESLRYSKIVAADLTAPAFSGLCLQWTALGGRKDTTLRLGAGPGFGACLWWVLGTWSLKPGRECLAAAWASFPQSSCQGGLCRGWQLPGCASLTPKCQGSWCEIICTQKVDENRCSAKTENYYVVQLSKGIGGRSPFQLIPFCMALKNK